MKRGITVMISCWGLLIFSLSPAMAQESLPRFAETECLIDMPDSAEITCGYLVTLEDQKDPGGSTIRLPVIIIHNRDGNPEADAILFTEGGPAYSSLHSVWWLSNAPFGSDHDIVILEQRGNLYAEPSLDCDVSVLWEEGVENTTCLESLKERGIDLSLYTTAHLAGDLDALRTALDYPAWNLLGTSYSTRLMQLVLQKQPDDIRSVVLSSILPITDTRYPHDPEHSARAIRVMLDACASDSTCAETYPNLEDQLFTLISDLNDEPVKFKLSYPGTETYFEYQVNGHDLIGWIVGDALYGPPYPPFKTAYLPLLISEVSAGHTDLLRAWAKEDFAGLVGGNFAWGLYLAVHCQDSAPSSSQAEMRAQRENYPELDGYIRHIREIEVCDGWKLPPSNIILNEPVHSDVPTLVLGGSFDPITPPHWSRTAVVNFTKNTFIELPAAGHNTLDGDPCPLSIVTAFLEDPTAPIDQSCLENMPEVEFILPDDMIIAPAIYEFHWNEIGASQLEENIFLIGAYGQVVAAAGISVIGLVNLIRRKKTYPRGPAAKLTQPLAVILTALSMLWGSWVSFVLRSIAETIPIALRFGMPSVTWPIFVLAMLIALLTVILSVLVLLAWKREYWSLTRRILVTLAALFAVVFTGMLAYWGWFTALFSLF